MVPRQNELKILASYESRKSPSVFVCSERVVGRLILEIQNSLEIFYTHNKSGVHH